MKFSSTVTLICASTIVGYIAEPLLRDPLTSGTSTTKFNLPEIPDEFKETPKPKIDISKVPTDQLPETLHLKKSCQIQDKESGLTINAGVGSAVTLVRISGTNVIITPKNTTLSTSVPISFTDLIEQLEAKLPPTTRTSPAFENNAPVTPRPNPVTPESRAVIPETVATNTDPAPVTPTPSPAPVTKEPRPTLPDAIPLASQLPPPGDQMPSRRTGNVVEAMQAHIRSGQIKAFKIDQVTDWKPTEDAELDGQLYQTGTATYQTETPFGVKKITAKAYIKDGKVARWIMPNTGVELK